MKRSITLAQKDLLLLWRDKSAVFWVLAFPLLIGALFGSIFGGDAKGASASKLAVVDQDRSKESQALVERLRKSTAVKVTEPDLEFARQAVRKGDLSAYLLIPSGYGEADRQFRAADKPLTLGTDPSRKAEIGMLQGVISEAAYGGLAEKFSDPSNMSSSAKDALANLDQAKDMSPADKASMRRFLQELDRFGESQSPGTRQSGQMVMQGPKLEVVATSGREQTPASAFEISFPQALLWGLLAVVSTFAISLVKERQQGTMVRLMVSPLSFREILAGKGIACFVACAGVMLLLLGAGVLVFGVRITSPVNLALAVGSSAFCLVGVMMLLSVLGKTEQAVSGSAWGVLILMSMFGGGMIPLFVMPGWMQAASSVSPLKWSIVAVEGAIWRGYTLPEMALPVGILLAVGALCFALGVRVLARHAD